MNKLQIINKNGVEAVDSREVAEMTGKNHKELLRDIRNYAEIIGNSNERNFALVDFFIPSTYTDSKGETRPCYLITKKGCDMVANKMTGEKGVLFTAAYVTAFEEMREKLSAPKAMSTAQLFAMQVQINLEQEQRMKALEEKTQATQETVQEAFSALSYPTVSRDHWQDETRQKIRRVCFENGLNYQKFTAQTYDELEADARVKLETRVNNQRERMKAGGAKSAEIQAVNKLTVIAADPKLRAIYSAIIQRHSAQFLTERLSNM